MRNDIPGLAVRLGDHFVSERRCESSDVINSDERMAMVRLVGLRGESDYSPTYRSLRRFLESEDWELDPNYCSDMQELYNKGSLIYGVDVSAAGQSKDFSKQNVSIWVAVGSGKI
jgi:hypothetical protein